MTVAQLIAALQAMPQDALVSYFSMDDYTYDTIYLLVDNVELHPEGVHLS